MIVKFGSEASDVFILEATGDKGVSIKNFAGIIPAIGNYNSKVVLSHLDWVRPDSSLDNLE